MTEYSELLEDPRWDERRKEILKLDNLTCRECLIKDVTLQVHHHYYHRDCQPWEYDDEVLITLCELCHEHEEFLKNFDLLSFQYLLNLGLTRAKVDRLYRAVGKHLDGVSRGDVAMVFEGIIKRLNG